VICNDGSYGAEHIQFTRKKLSPALSMTSPPDFTSMARAIGMSAYRVATPADLDSALKNLERSRGPNMIELSLDADHIDMD
jgi:thiamine pyrophosphate-dependent acetolactate synthase large subunit-like protein